MPTLDELIAKVKRETDPARVGMILCHNGVVRATTRTGEPAECLDVTVDEAAWERVLADARRLPGVAAVEAYHFSGCRRVGEDVMYVVIAADIRENAFPALEATVNRLKTEAVKKREW